MSGFTEEERQAWGYEVLQNMRTLMIQIESSEGCVNEEECIGDCSHCRSVSTWNEIAEMLRQLID